MMSAVYLACFSPHSNDHGYHLHKTETIKPPCRHNKLARENSVQKIKRNEANYATITKMAEHVFKPRRKPREDIVQGKTFHDASLLTCNRPTASSQSRFGT